jgi:hypothetical protein
MKLLSFVFFACLIIFSCTEEEITQRAYPRVMTYEPTEITLQGGNFHGEITFTGVDIIDHGFVWTANGFPTITLGEKISLGPRQSVGRFDAAINYKWEPGRRYSIRAYAVSAQHVVYGKTFDKN